MNFPKWIHFNGFIAIAFFVLFAFQLYVILPFQENLISWGAYSGTLIFLPHGIRIFAVMTGGWKAAIGLYVGHLASGYYLNDMTTLQIFIQGLLSVLAVYLPYYLFNLKEVNLKNILILAALSSFLNSEFQTMYLSFSLINQNVYLIFSYLIGDIVGSVFCLYLLKYLRYALPKFIT